MNTKPKKKPVAKRKPNKQAEVTAASFLRLAKVAANNGEKYWYDSWNTFATALRTEAARIRRKP